MIPLKFFREDILTGRDYFERRETGWSKRRSEALVWSSETARWKDSGSVTYEYYAKPDLSSSMLQSSCRDHGLRTDVDNLRHRILKKFDQLTSFLPSELVILLSSGYGSNYALSTIWIALCSLRLHVAKTFFCFRRLWGTAWGCRVVHPKCDWL